MVRVSVYLKVMGSIIPSDNLIIKFIQPVVAIAFQSAFEPFLSDPQTASVDKPKSHFYEFETISLNGIRGFNGFDNVTKFIKDFLHQLFPRTNLRSSTNCHALL